MGLGFAALDLSQNVFFAAITSCYFQFSRVSSPSVLAEVKVKHKASLALKPPPRHEDAW
jgi:hypothetical protein